MSDITSGRFTPAGAHEISYRVYYEDTDAAGVMYYANYLKFAERARTEALRAAGIQQSDLLATERLGFVVRRASVDYRVPATLDDTVLVRTQLLELAKVRLKMRQQMLRGDTVLAEAQVEIVMVDAAMRPVRVPEELSTLLTRHLKPQTNEQ